MALTLQNFLGLDRLFLDQARDQIVHGDAIGFGSERGDDAVSQHRKGECLHIVNGHVRPTFQECSRLRSQHQLLAGSGPGPPFNQIFGPGLTVGVSGSNCANTS